MFHNVIVGTDGDEVGRDALSLATQLTSADAQLALAYVQVVVKPDLVAGEVSLATDRLPIMERLASLRDEAEVDAHVLCVQAASVAAGLHGLARLREADLLVVGGTRADAVERAFVGDHTQDVLEKAPCPVAVVPRGYATDRPPLRRVGAGYDGSPESDEAVAVARRLAAELRAELSAFQAVREPIRVRDRWDPQPEIDASVAQTRERVAALGDIEPRAAAGEPVEELAHYGTYVDLMVVGSHRYRPIDHVVGGGSTAQRLAADPSCPLLVLSASQAPAR